MGRYGMLCVRRRVVDARRAAKRLLSLAAAFIAAMICVRPAPLPFCCGRHCGGVYRAASAAALGCGLHRGDFLRAAGAAALACSLCVGCADVLSRIWQRNSVCATSCAADATIPWQHSLPAAAVPPAKPPTLAQLVIRAACRAADVLPCPGSIYQHRLLECQAT